MKFVVFIGVSLLLVVSSASAQKNSKWVEIKREKAGAERIKGVPNQSATEAEQIPTSTKNTAAVVGRSVNILKKPNPLYPSINGGTVCMQGAVMLRVMFLADGTIGNIAVIKGLPYGATENAIEAARKIEFEPALRDGIPVTSSRPVSFRFSY